MVHVGALQALEENGIFPDSISGTSAGSIVGAMYAKGYTPSEIMGTTKESTLLKILSVRVPNKGFVKHTFLRKQLKKYLPENSFEQLKRPFYVTISNLNTGLVETKHNGPLHDYIVASCSVPLLFEPVEIDGDYYVDGGLMKNLPASVLRDHADIVIGVNLVPQLRVETKEIKSLVGVAVRCFNLAALNNITPELRYCDAVIEPPEIHHFNRWSFSQMDEMYRIGYDETMRMMPKIKELISTIEKK